MGARRMASTTSDTGDTSSKQQQAQRKENRRLADLELLSGYETGHCGRPRSTGRGLRVHSKRETRAIHLFSLAVFFHKIMLQKARRGKEINRGVVDQLFSHLYFSAEMKKAKGCIG